MDNVWISTISQKIQSKSKASDVQPGKIVGGVKKQEKITVIYLEASKIKGSLQQKLKKIIWKSSNSGSNTRNKTNNLKNF